MVGQGPPYAWGVCVALLMLPRRRVVRIVRRETRDLRPS